MDKIFGEVDYVEAGERENRTEVIEFDAYSSALPQGDLKSKTTHNEDIESSKKS